MDKAIHAVEFDGTTFGMNVDASSTTYRKFKNQIKAEKAISAFSDSMIGVLAVPAVWLGAIMGEAHWMVTESRLIDHFTIEGLMSESKIYVKYDDAVIDFKTRRQKYHRHN